MNNNLIIVNKGKYNLEDLNNIISLSLDDHFQL